MKRILSLILALALLSSAILTLSSCKKKDITYVEIQVADYGNIICALDANYAPITVENFLKLVDDGFYDGLTFHRMQVGFVLQGGCPKGDGTGSTAPIKGEFAANGVENDLAHVRGVLSMARRGDSYDSGSCQFFICHQDARASLDGQYAAFGYVVEGMEVVDAIAAYVQENQYEVMRDYMGSLYPQYQPVIKTIKRIDYTPSKS
ncbi:MAG: peptidylprolyl isomerase [Clostridia bacterium]|nr:peptidylprolyl isomerase [Clostridia bacterium]